MLSYLFFKKTRSGFAPHVPVGSLLLLLFAAFSSGCGSAPCVVKGDRGSVGLCGPVRSVLLEMGSAGGEALPTSTADLRPREYREFDREGRLTLQVEFGKDGADTLALARRYHDAAGRCVKMLRGKPAAKKGWSWERTEYGYDGTGELLWSAEFGDTLALVPHTVFCYSSGREEEAECLARWKSVKTLKIVYRNERGVPQGEQWLLEGKSYGAIRYDADTVLTSGKRFVRYRLPGENVADRNHRYVANFYDDAGRLVEQWGYVRSAPTSPIYSYTDLSDILRFDSLGRTVFQLVVGNDPSAPLYRTAFEFDERGNILRQVRAAYASFDAFMKGEALNERVAGLFEYAERDRHGNWLRGNTKGEAGGMLAVMRRTIEYY